MGNHTHSLSVLQALGKLKKTDHPLLIQIQDLLHKINADQKEIVFMWIPGHVGIRRNDAVDRAPKEALDKKATADLIPFSDLNLLLPDTCSKFGRENGIELFWYLVSFM